MIIQTVAFIGCGRITRAIATGLIAAGWPPQHLRAVSRNGVSARTLAAETGLLAVESTDEAVSAADLVVLAVHPQDAAAALGQVRRHLEEEQLLLSLVASWPTAAVADAVEHAAPVLRAVPNVAVAVRAGVTVLCAGPGAHPTHLSAAQAVFRRIGQIFVVDETHMETVSALSGAGPALLARFAMALAEAAVAQGLPPELAGRLAAYVVQGTGALLAETSASFDGVMAAVASPGGMTQQALDTLDRLRVPDAAALALEAAVRLSLNRMPNTGAKSRLRATSHP